MVLFIWILGTGTKLYTGFTTTTLYHCSCTCHGNISLHLFKWNQFSIHQLSPYFVTKEEQLEQTTQQTTKSSMLLIYRTGTLCKINFWHSNNDSLISAGIKTTSVWSLPAWKLFIVLLMWAKEYRHAHAHMSSQTGTRRAPSCPWLTPTHTPDVRDTNLTTEISIDFIFHFVNLTLYLVHFFFMTFNGCSWTGHCWLWETKSGKKIHRSKNFHY